MGKLTSIVTSVVLMLCLATPAMARKTFPATHDSIPAENRRADMQGLKRYEDMTQVASDIEAGILVPLTTPVSPKLPLDRRYARPETVSFAEKLDRDFYETTEQHIVVDSAVRPVSLQKRLHRRMWNAAPAIGARASSHERGTTFDISRRMRRRDYRWLLWRLLYYRARGDILVIEERSCIHIFVGRGDEQSENRSAGDERVGKD